MIPSAYEALAALVGAFILCVVSFTYGVHVTNDHWKATELGLQQKIEQQQMALVKQQNDAEAALETARNQQQVVYRDITKNVDRVVTRTVYSRACFDADGLQLANSALAGKATAPAKPH